jgi:N-acetylmuramoyl-L-alanine amidase
MSSRSFLIYFFAVLQILFFPVDLFADNNSEKPSSLSKRYDEAKIYYNQLQTKPSLSTARENWLKGAGNFRRIYLSSIKSDLAPACLFMLGRIYGDMHDRFQKIADLEESISYFKDITRIFPKNRLADDGYFALSRISLEKQKNPQKAADYLVQIVSNYPMGDMHSKAEELLKVLSKENGIPLPQQMASSSDDSNLSHVLPIKYWSSDDYTRVVIVASSQVSYKEVLLKETDNTPRRLYIDFKKSYIEPQYRSPVPIEEGLLRRIHTRQFSPDTVRVVLDIESIKNYKIFNLPDPFRVVIDVRGKKKQKEVTAPLSIVKTQEKIKIKTTIEKASDIVILKETKKIVLSPATTIKNSKVKTLPQTTSLSLAQQLGLGVKKIIIDPGHGGKDPGAMAFGMKEKDIVLDIAKKLAPILEKELHCEVLLTRDRDVFIPLEERTAIANSKNADLFISLHINAHPSAKVRGLETYYLNLTTNAEAMRVAARENATSTHQMSELQNILSDIMKNSKIRESSRLAQLVHNSIVKKAAINGFADIKNLGVKQAPFYVLIGAEMPAILIEIAFISNEKDVKNLQNSSFVNMLTQEIAFGIRAYVNDTTASGSASQHHHFIQ